MTSFLLFLLVWCIISVPVALFVGAAMALSNGETHYEDQSHYNTTHTTRRQLDLNKEQIA